MNLRRWALTCCLVAAMAHCDPVMAGTWGMDPVLGILGDYSTDPALLHQRDTAIASGALLLDSPTTYDDGRFKFFGDPNFRVGDSRGYSSVTSDYEHLNVKGEFDTDRSTFSAGGGLARDSSLNYNYLTSGAVGVRRDATNADVNWDRYLTERVEFDVDANWQRVLFGQTAGVPTLTDYKYTSVAPALSWGLNERGKLTLAGSVGRYDSLDTLDSSGLPTSTGSRSANLQLGFVGQLNELWALTALGGYSRALNQSKFNQYNLVLVPSPSGAPSLSVQVVSVDAKSSQNGSVYALNLTRQGSQLSLNANASRQLIPTGFAYLTRTDSYELKASYRLSERWLFSGDARAQRYQNPLAGGTGSGEVNVRYLGMSVNWNWTEHWTVALGLARVAQRVELPVYTVASNEVTLTLSHPFDHLTLQ